MTEKEQKQQRRMILLIEHVNKQEQFINNFFDEAQPIAKELNETKNVFFKIFKFIKLAFQLAILILKAINNKPDPFDFIKF